MTACSAHRVDDNPFNVSAKSGNCSGGASVPSHCFVAFLDRTVRPDKSVSTFRSEGGLNTPSRILGSPGGVLRRQSLADIPGSIVYLVVWVRMYCFGI